MLASNQPIDRRKDDPKLQARIKAGVTWPCRFHPNRTWIHCRRGNHGSPTADSRSLSLDETLGKSEPTPQKVFVAR